MTARFLETGQTVRWRGRRWRVLEEPVQGFVTLTGIDPANRDQIARPYLPLEGDAVAPDERPLPPLNVEASDRSRWRALHQAHLLTMAGGREQLMGLDWGAVAVEPYQLVPLMRVARQVRPRLLIADDTGLGKTAEAGLILRWLAQRHQAQRVLIVTRASPDPERWQREMWIKFGFRFDILQDGTDFQRRRQQSPLVNVFAQSQKLIISMTLAARQVFLDELRKCPAPFDVVVVDEAHHLAMRGNRTKRLTVLGRALRDKVTDGSFLLLTATPHDGKSESFLSLLRLLDPLIDPDPGNVPIDVASRLVVRRLKSEVTLIGGKKFVDPKIHVHSTISGGYVSDQERAINAPLDAYLDWLRARESEAEKAGARQKAKGYQFLAGVYRKRFGSSVAALRATLRRRLDLPPADEDQDELVPFVDTEASDPEDEIIDPGAVADAPPPGLTAEEAELARALLAAAERVPRGRDSKLEAMVSLLNRQIAEEKAVVFTEYRDTLRAAARRLDAEGINYVSFHGATPDVERSRAIKAFLHDPDARVFLATDAASEGKNLQKSCHHLIHLDVPWNPNRYAQRNGRIDRYGQLREPNIWVLIAADRRNDQGRPEHRATEVVIEKLKRIQAELGSVGPILPGFTSGRVSDVLMRSTDTAESEMEEAVEDTAAEQAHHELTRLAVRNQREIEDADTYVRRMGTVDDFEATIGELLRTAFRGWDDGGRMQEIEPGILRVQVPRRLRDVLGESIIERATFQRELAVAGQDEEEWRSPEFLSPAHPLVESTLQMIRDEAADPQYAHRFDVAASSREGLILSFLSRFVDGDGRTVEEKLEPVEVSDPQTVSHDPEADLERLSILNGKYPGRPDADAIVRWSTLLPEVHPPAIGEAERRAATRRGELEETATELWEEELDVLARWRDVEARRVETVIFGDRTKISFEEAATYEERMRILDAEYERRKDAVRDRSEVRLAGIELIGGRLLVPEAGP